MWKLEKSLLYHVNTTAVHTLMWFPFLCSPKIHSLKCLFIVTILLAQFKDDNDDDDIHELLASTG